MICFSRWLIAALALFSMLPLQASMESRASGEVSFRSGEHEVYFRADGYRVTASGGPLEVAFQGSVSAPPRDIAGDVVYPNLWPGIRAVYDSARGILRSTFVVSSGAMPELIRLEYGAPVRIRKDGSLSIVVGEGRFTETPPIAWQEVEGRRQPVDVGFREIDQHTVGFMLGSYDPSLPLVIDPTLEWLNLLGSDGGVIRNEVNAATADASGNYYVTGFAEGDWTETVLAGGGSGTPVSDHVGGRDVYVAKLKSSGGVLWHTFLGGADNEEGNDLVIAGGKLFVTGYTQSSSWSDGGSASGSLGGVADAFLAEIDPGTGALDSMSYIGGTDDDEGFGIATDGTFLYMTGRSKSDDWTATGQLTEHSNDGTEDLFITKMNTSGVISWYAFYGDSGIDWGTDVVVDGGSVYVSGFSSDAWSATGLAPVRGYTAAETGTREAMTLKFNATGTLQWYGFLGGEDDDQTSAHGSLAVSGGMVYVTGNSKGPDWGELAGDPVRAHGGGEDIFVAALQESDGALQWYTFLGGAGDDEGTGLFVDSAGNIRLVGESSSSWGTPDVLFSYGAFVDYVIGYLDSSDGLLLSHGFWGGIFDDGAGYRDYFDFTGGVAKNPSTDGFLVVGTSGGTLNGVPRWDAAATYFAPEGLLAIYGNELLISDADFEPTPDDGTDFGLADVGAGGVVHNFILRNIGSEDATLAHPDGTSWPYIYFLSNEGGGFGIDWPEADNKTPRTLYPGEKIAFSVSFDPVSVSALPEEAFLFVEQTYAPADPYSFAITGATTEAPQINVYGPDYTTAATSDWRIITGGDVTPSSDDGTDFGSIAYDAVTNPSETFEIRNDGSAQLTLDGSPYVSLSNSTDFSVTSQPSSPVAAGAKTQVTIEFDPATPGTKETTVTIPWNDAEKSPRTFTLRGVGTGPDIALTGNNVDIVDGDESPALVDHTSFSVVSLDDTFTRTFVINNLGEDELTISGISVANHSGSAFAKSGVEPASVAANGGSATFDVAFTPTATVSYAATVTISNNDPDDEGSFTFKISGSGGLPEMAVRTDAGEIADGGSANIGAEAGGTTSMTFTIENSAVGANLNLTGSPTIELSNMTQFSVTADPVTPVEGRYSTSSPVSSETFKISYTAPGDGSGASTTVTIANNDANENPYDFTLYGSTPSLSLDKTEVTVTEQDVDNGNYQVVTVSASSSPSDDVVVEFFSNDSGEVLLWNGEGSESYAASATVTIPADAPAPATAELWLRGVDDDTLDLDQTARITASVSSSDTAYHGDSLPVISVTNRNRHYSTSCSGSATVNISVSGGQTRICRYAGTMTITGSSVASNGVAGFYATIVKGGNTTTFASGSTVHVSKDISVLDVAK